MHDHDPTAGGLALWLNIAANLAIVAGYVIVPFTVLRHLPLTRSVRFSGSIFFATCAFSHVAMAFGFEHSGAMLVNHVVQAVAVVAFVWGFYRLLQRADKRRGRRDGERR